MTFLLSDLFLPRESLPMAKMTTSPYKTDDPVYGDVAKMLLLAQFLGVKKVWNSKIRLRENAQYHSEWSKANKANTTLPKVRARTVSRRRHVLRQREGSGWGRAPRKPVRRCHVECTRSRARSSLFLLSCSWCCRELFLEQKPHGRNFFTRYLFIVLSTYAYQIGKKGPKRSQRLEVPRSFGHV